MDPKRTRRYVETIASQHEEESGREAVEYRVDLERLRFSAYFGRLAAVTQVVPQSGVGPIMHNRLTHSLKVSAVARVIASRIVGSPDSRPVLEKLGGCDTIVSQAAAHAHDLGHPPFGHLGERVLDRLARTRLGLPEGFEGNAQTFRIITNLDTLGRPFGGLNLTAAVRASVLKYPWTRAEWAGSNLPPHERPPGVGTSPGGAEKYSMYSLEAEEAREALAAFNGVRQWQQTVDCGIMDIADDIAYAVHDLDDFTRAGVLQYAAVSAELRGWLNGTGGESLERRWQEILRKDQWIADRDAFHDAVDRVNTEFVEDLLARPYDGGIVAERAVSTFTRNWIEHLRSSVELVKNPNVRGGHVQLGVQAWHEVAVLKFVHAHFVLQGPQLALEQRGLARVLRDLVLAFDDWLDDPIDRDRAPVRLLEDIEQVTDETINLARREPRLVTGTEAELRRMGRSRAILDHVASLTDQQAIVTHSQLILGR